MLSLHAAGKSSILYHYQHGRVLPVVPNLTHPSNTERLQFKNSELLVWDTGSRDRYRPLWKPQGVIFVVDSVQNKRITEAKDYLNSIDAEDDLKGVPIAIALNKRDLPHCMSREEMVEKLDLGQIQEQRPCQAFFTTVKPNVEVDTEIDKLFEWITIETTKNQNVSSLPNGKVDPFTAYIWQPIMKVKNSMFD
jgi:GTPase SAR1 family protein